MLQYQLMIGQETSHLVIRGMFNEPTRNLILEYVDKWVPLLPLSRDDNEFIRLYYHNPPTLVAVHKNITDVASEIFGEKVKPSYCFLSMYTNGGTCPLHIDRPQCRYTIDYLVCQDQTDPWPLHISSHMSDEARSRLDLEEAGHPRDKAEIDSLISRETWSEVLLNPNDAVCYSGTNSWHYRPTKLSGKATLIFWHFVPEDFDGLLN